MTADTLEAAPQSLLQRLLAWAHKVHLERKLAISLLVVGLVSGVSTISVLARHDTAASDPLVIVLLLNLDLIILLGLGALVARRLVILWVERRRGRAGSRLHIRLVALFSLLAVIPTIVVVLFSMVVFNLGLQSWFSERVGTAVGQSFAVAQAYLKEHRHAISSDALAMANDFNREGPLLIYNQPRFKQVIAAQLALRSLTEAIVFDDTGRVLAEAGYDLMLQYNPEIPDWALQKANAGEVALLDSDGDRVRALVKLNTYVDTYLVVGRFIDPRVLAHIERTEGAVQLYEDLEGRRSGIQITFALIFAVVALLILLAAVWVGLASANQLSRPIGSLIAAAESVRRGNLTTRVNEPERDDELASLSRAFNRMTDELGSQRRELLQANLQLDDRRRFIEAVLGGVSAGVIGLDREARITLVNRSACDLLSIDAGGLRGRAISDCLPEMAALVERARRRPGKISQQHLNLEQADGNRRSLLVRATAEVDEEGANGFVITFDDISELEAAQRKAAWADVARRIAHEIKNPLTPIQLSAERLKKKYLKQIEDDPDTFKICTDTIVRQVADIGRMVDEFSSFARMPTPVLAEESLAQLVEQSVFLQRSAHPGITFVSRHPEQPIIQSCDRQQIGRALTNLLLNAVEAIKARRATDGTPLPRGCIEVRLASTGGQRTIDIEDNGCGLPPGERDRLTEPYVTTRERGTGLGLAIVKKIMEDHGGDLVLEDRPGGGARARLIFPGEVEKGPIDTPCSASNQDETAGHVA